MLCVQINPKYQAVCTGAVHKHRASLKWAKDVAPRCVGWSYPGMLSELIIFKWIPVGKNLKWFFFCPSISSWEFPEGTAGCFSLVKSVGFLVGCCRPRASLSSACCRVKSRLVELANVSALWSAARAPCRSIPGKPQLTGSWKEKKKDWSFKTFSFTVSRVLACYNVNLTS